jgi:hypothetical protein
LKVTNNSKELTRAKMSEQATSPAPADEAAKTPMGPDSPIPSPEETQLTTGSAAPKSTSTEQSSLSEPDNALTKKFSKAEHEVLEQFRVRYTVYA